MPPEMMGISDWAERVMAPNNRRRTAHTLFPNIDSLKSLERDDLESPARVCMNKLRSAGPSRSRIQHAHEHRRLILATGCKSVSHQGQVRVMFVHDGRLDTERSIVSKPDFEVREILYMPVVSSDVGTQGTEMVAVRIFGRIEPVGPQYDLDAVLFESGQDILHLV